jgi:hypothetical protein
LENTLTVPFDITDPVVNELGNGIESSQQGEGNAPDGMRWDCTIGGLPFLFGISDQYPMQRETAQFRRDRVDTERNPGEQSLDSGLWIRSQASWHYGAGLSSAEPLEVASDEAQFRYAISGGVDPWTPGQLQLLNSASSVFSASATAMQVQGIQTGVLFGEGDGDFNYVTNAGAATPITWGGSGPLFSFTDTGEVYLASGSAGIYKGTLPSGSGSLIYNKHYGTVRYSLIRWVKSRAFYAENQGIWELTNLSPSSATIGSPFYAHPNAGWTWTDFADGPRSVYASGYSLENSAIYRMGVAVTASTVTLEQPVVVAEMPRGEDVLSLYSYVGAFLVIGTTAGVRVAIIQDDGSLAVGPLVFNGTQVDDAVAFGQFVYVTVRDTGQAGDRVTRPGLYRINLGQNLNQNPLQFAYAPDMVIPSNDFDGGCVSVTVSGGKIWFAVTGTENSGLYKQTDEFVDEGWLETGRIRLGTVEKKAWRDLRVLAADGIRGRVDAYASITGLGAPSSWNQVVEANVDFPDNSGGLTSVAPVPSASLFAAFKLVTDPTCGCSARMTGYQVRAIPSPKRNELISVPLLMFNREKDRQGVSYGKDNNAYLRYRALKDMENSGAMVVFRDFTTGEQLEVFVERVEYIRTAPPTRQEKANGGLVRVLLRAV